MTDADIQRLDNGWHVRVPVHAEEVRIEKRAVVVEEIDIRREMVEEVEDTVPMHREPIGLPPRFR